MWLFQIWKQKEGIERNNEKETQVVKQKVDILSELENDNVLRCYGWTTWLGCKGIVIEYMHRNLDEGKMLLSINKYSLSELK